MPWTLSHPAAVLPLRRLCPFPLDFPALVIGSMTPDVGYYLRRFDLSNFAHSVPGSFLACLPCGVIMLCIFYLFCRPVCYALPLPHRQVLLPLCPDFPIRLWRWAILLFSLLLGAWSHNFWDAWTHEHGWFVDRIPALQPPILWIGAAPVQMFLFLQELSTVVGCVIIIVVYWRWLRRQAPAKRAASDGPDGWRYALWLTLVCLSFALSLPAAVRHAMTTSLHGFLFARSIVFWTAIYSHSTIVPLVMVGTGFFYLRRER